MLKGGFTMAGQAGKLMNSGFSLKVDKVETVDFPLDARYIKPGKSTVPLG